MNKFMKKLMKKSEGFTLVELIVVIAILAILAGIAVPAYSGYIDSAHEAADTTALGAIKTAVLASTAAEGPVTQIVVAVGNDGKVSTITVTGGGYTSATDIVADTGKQGADFDIFYVDELPTLESKTFGSGAKWTPDGGWVKNQ